MLQSLGTVMIWIGGSFILGVHTTTDTVVAVQVGWFLVAIGYGLLHGYGRGSSPDDE